MFDDLVKNVRRFALRGANLDPAMSTTAGRCEDAVKIKVDSILGDVGPMEPPMSDFVCHAEAIPAGHRWVLLRIKAVVNQDSFGIDPDGTEEVRLVTEHRDAQHFV